MSHSLCIVTVPNDDYKVENETDQTCNKKLLDDNVNNIPETTASENDVSVKESNGELPSIQVTDHQEATKNNSNDAISEEPLKTDNNKNDDDDDDDVTLSKQTSDQEEDHSHHYKNRVRRVLKEYSVDTDTWKLSDDQQTWQVLFTTVSSNVDAILNSLLNVSIGNNTYSSINIVPIQVNFPGMLHSSDEGEMQVSSEFVQSIKSRLTVAQVINSVQSGSHFTFDYVMLIMMASIIALVGLLENSSVLLVASMLVSPLMGPILGGTFGIVMQYKPLWSMGVKNEVIGLAICVVVGFLLGFIFIHVPGWKHVTQEMSSRGAAWSLLVGVLVALPSGAGVALSILGGNAGSLVGVAISASLLPPAVNAGLCWSYSAYLSASGETLKNETSDIIYDASEVAKIGALSLTLTMLNIFLIFLMGVIILKVKEIAPHTGTAVTTRFWKNDIKTTRDYLKKMQDMRDMRQNESLNDELLDQIMNEAGVEFDSKKTVKGENSRKLKGNIRQLKQKATLVDSFLPKTFSNAQSLENSVLYLRERLQEKNETASRFHVSRVYNLVDTAFPTNSRFVVSSIDVRDEIPTKKKKTQFTHLSGVTKIRKSSQQSGLNVPLVSTQTDEDVESKL